MEYSKKIVVIYRIGEKVELFFGALIAILFGLVAIICMFDNEKDGAVTIIIYWLIAAIGIWLFQLGRKRNKFLKYFKEYVTRLSADPAGSIKNLAATLNTSQDVVKANLQKMIDSKFFGDAYIDEANNRIIFPIGSNINIPVQNGVISNLQNQNVEYVVVTCKSCGGINKILKDKVSVCEYCGSPIKN